MATALVTGASAGLGREFAGQLASRGYDLVVVARDAARLDELAGELGSRYGVAVEVLTADLADREQVQRVAERLSDVERPIDLLVNNAGFGLRTGFLDGDLAEEERALDVMLRAVMVLSHAGARAMRTRGHGAVLNVSSVAGSVTMSTYSAIKSGVSVFTEVLSNELAGSGVTATVVCPGFTRTEFHDRARMRMHGLPNLLWLQAPRVVSQALDDVAAGTVISVPSLQYRAVTAVVRHAPRGVVRRYSGQLGRRRRG